MSTGEPRSSRSTHRGSPGLPGLAVGALFVGLVALLSYFTQNGRVNNDEGWYLYAARLVYEGAVPYRDFPFYQAPLLPYVYGLIQEIFGAGLSTGRFTSMALGTATAALGARLAFERGGRAAALLFLALLATTPVALWSFATTRTEPLSAFLLMLSVFLLLRLQPGPAARSGALVAAVCAAGTRVSSLPFTLLVAIYVVRCHRGSARELALVLGPAVLVAGVLSIVALSAGPDVGLFLMVGVQAQRHEQLAPAEAWELGHFALRRVRDVAVLQALYGSVPLLAAATASGSWAMWLRARDRAAHSLVPVAAALAALAVAAYLPNLATRSWFPIYFASVFPLFLVLAVWPVGYAFERAGAARAAVVGAAVTLVLFQLVTFADRRERQLAPGELAGVKSAARYVADLVPPDRTLLTLDVPLAVESGRRLVPGFEMGMFSYFPRLSEEEGGRLGVVTPGRLRAALADRSVGAVALSDHALGILVAHSSKGYRPRQTLTEAELHAALPGLRDYRLTRVFQPYGQHRDALYVLSRE